jgi:hypothetical protein
MLISIRILSSLSIYPISQFEEVDGVVVHSLGFSAEGSGFESRPRPGELMKLFSIYQNSTNVDSLELHL